MSSQDTQIQIGEKSYTVRFSVRAMNALQEHWKLKSFQEVAKKISTLQENVQIDDLVGFVWAGLRTHHRDLTKEDVFDLIDEVGVQGIEGLLSSALSGSLPTGSVTKGGESGDGQPNP